MGENYVLGNRDDCNQFTPFTVHPKMFDELPVLMLGAGTQHVVVLTSDTQDNKDFPQFEEEVLAFQLPPEVKPVKEKPVPVPRVKKEKPVKVVKEEKKHDDAQEEEKLSDKVQAEPMEDVNHDHKEEVQEVPSSAKATPTKTEIVQKPL